MSHLKEELHEIMSPLDYKAFVSLQQKATSIENTVMCLRTAILKVAYDGA